MDATEGDHLDSRTCLELLGRSQLGRVGLSIGAIPGVVPVRYGIGTEGIVLSCALDGAAKAMDQSIVALQADGLDEDSGRCWTVYAVGRTYRLADEARGMIRDSIDPRAGQSSGFWDASNYFLLRPEIFSGSWFDAW